MPAEFHVVPPSSPKRQAADAGIECIGCGVCYASCDIVAWNGDYLGPAALNRAWTLVNDVRDGARQASAWRRWPAMRAAMPATPRNPAPSAARRASTPPAPSPG